MCVTIFGDEGQRDGDQLTVAEQLGLSAAGFSFITVDDNQQL